MKKNSNLYVLLRGLIAENPVFVLVLGTCPTLAVTTTLKGAIGMGIAALAVLVCSNIVISLLRKVIPDMVRIPCYIVVIAGFVSMVQLIVRAYFPDIYNLLGSYLGLIVVNCIILGRAEMFASKNSVGKSALDGLGMGLGFTLALMSMAFIRELLGNGELLEYSIPFFKTHTIGFFTSSPGGFFVFGIMIAIVAKITNGRAPKKKTYDACETCPSAAFCMGACSENNEKEGVQ